MASVKIKHPTKTHQTQFTLVQVLSSQDVFASSIIEVRDGYVVLTENYADIEQIFTPEITQALQDHDFSPVFPPELRARCTGLFFNLDNHIKGNSVEDIKEEIYDNNNSTRDDIKYIIKVPRSRIMKIVFKQSTTATWSTEQGMKMFHMRIPSYNIKREEYIPI